MELDDSDVLIATYPKTGKRFERSSPECVVVNNICIFLNIEQLTFGHTER